MSSLRLVLASLAYYWRLHSAVGLGVAVATAVLAGALMVGDSMRASLRDLVLDRLGRIDEVLLTDRFFRAALADEVAACEGFADYFSEARPAILLRATVARADRGDRGKGRRATRVGLLGTGPWFWEWGCGSRPQQLPGAGQIVLNRRLADVLNVGVGDEVLVRLPQPGLIPADSPLGRKTDTVRSRRLVVQAIVPTVGLGRFDLRFRQQPPLNAYMAIDALQTILDQPGKANAILVAGKSAAVAAPPEASQRLARSLRPELADYGLSLKRVERRFQDAVVLDYFNLTSDRLLLPRPVERAALRAFTGVQPQLALTYLANDIASAGGQARIPYSTVTGIDSTERLGPLDVDVHGKAIGPLTNDEIVLNHWAAADLARQKAGQAGHPNAGPPASAPPHGIQAAVDAALRPGDLVALTYFEPDTAARGVREATATFRLKAIAPLARRGARPQRTVDPDLTPEVPGVTDEKSLEDWNPPFPYDPSRVRSTPPNSQDEDYWDEYGTTPKAFVSLTTARRLWSSRFGAATSVRVPPGPGRTLAGLGAHLRRELDPAALGFAFRPVKRLGLTAAGGNTPFEWLFLGFSMFLIAASVMLVAVLFRLGVQQRTAEIGALLAVGWARRTARRHLCAEGAVVAAAGGLLGMLGGIAFAWTMLAALQSPFWWLRAIGARFLRLAVEPSSLAVGYATSVFVCVVVIAWTVRGTSRAAVRQLLSGRFDGPVGLPTKPTPVGRWAPAALVALAAILGLVAVPMGGGAQAGAFFGAGALVLGGALALVRNQLRTESTRPLLAAGAWPLLRLAWRNAARYPTRSTLTIGLVAAASFLIVAISAFRLEPSPAGAGGFDLYAETDVPVHQDLNTRAGRDDFGFSVDAAQVLASSRVLAFRVQDGDDASCLNLYQSSQPRVLGVPAALIGRGGFAWAGTAAKTPAERANPWLLLTRKRHDSDPAIPVVIDHDTALYSLHLWRGVGERFRVQDGRGGRVTFEVVGLLDHSIFGGDLLIAESAFVQLYPDVSGYRLLLVDAPPGDAGRVARVLDDRLGDIGFSAVSTATRLQQFLAVQNTYLSAFQCLGALGLVLGTFGLATVQLRSVLGRRSELAVLRAAGFGRRRLTQLVMLESLVLLGAGLGVGVLAAVVAVLPHGLLGGASIPWVALGAMLTIVLLAGVAAGLVAVRAVLKTPLSQALRTE